MFSLIGTTLSSYTKSTLSYTLMYYDADYIYNYCETSDLAREIMYEPSFWRSWLEYNHPEVKSTYGDTYESFQKRMELVPLMISFCQKHQYVPLLELFRKSPDSPDLYMPYPIHQKIVSGEVHCTFISLLLSKEYNYHYFGYNMILVNELNGMRRE